MQNLVYNDSFEILTPSGWQDFSGVKKDIKQTCLIKFTNGNQFECTLNHVFIDKNKSISASSLKPGDIICDKKVVEIRLYRTIDVYDPLNVSNGNLYYSEGLVSHNCAFLGSSLTLIDASCIGRLSPTVPVYTNENGLDLFEYPEKDHSYVIIVDTGKGVGGDYSTFSIVDITSAPYKQVGKYRNNKISPMLYPNVIHKVATDYNMAYVLIENNSSEQVGSILYSELEYENILFVSRTSKGQYVTGGFGGGSTQLGVYTDKKIKRIGCTTFKALVEENKLLIRDIDTISEISTFIERKGSFSADDGYHDDLVMPLVLFGWLTTNPYFKDLNNTNIRQEMYESHIRQIENELTPFGFYDAGSYSEDVAILNTKLPEKDNYGLTEDQLELLKF